MAEGKGGFLNTVGRLFRRKESPAQTPSTAGPSTKPDLHLMQSTRLSSNDIRPRESQPEEPTAQTATTLSELFAVARKTKDPNLIENLGMFVDDKNGKFPATKLPEEYREAAQRIRTKQKEMEDKL